jgi:Mg2+-importing ATPase
MGAAALAAVVLLVAHFADERAFVSLLEQARPSWLLWALCLQAATYAAQAEIWRLVLRRAGAHLPFGVAYRLSLAKLFVDQALPSVGVSGAVVVTQALQARGEPRPAVMAAVTVDTASYFTAYVLCLAVALAILIGQGHASALIIVVAGLFFVFGTSLAVGVLSLSGRDPGPWGARLLKVPGIGRALALLQQAEPHLARNPGVLLRSTLLQVAITVLDAGTIWVLIRALGTDASPGSIFASFMISSLLRTFGFMPGGLGTFEAASVATLALIGIPVTVGLSATLLFRGLSFWLPMVPGLAFSRRLTTPTANATSSAGPL